MVEICESQSIAGVKLARLRVLADERGHFLETFRAEWFPERSWDKVQTNCSQSRAGVLRGLHYHHKQVDYWYVARGSIRAALVDLRPGSPTQGASEMLEISEADHLGLFIPIGVAHGFLALTDVTLTYLLDNYYDGNDEHGVAWNDPVLGLDWGIAAPILSARDWQNPPLRDIPAHRLPPPYEKSEPR